MRAPRGLVHLLLVVALLWQGAAGALALGRMASLDAAFAGAICRPGASDLAGAPASPAGAALDHDACAVHCGAVVAAPPPSPTAPARAVAFAAIRFYAPRPALVVRAQAAGPPPARGPPSAS